MSGWEGAHPRQNRVLPTGEIITVRARGLLMGNRGSLHDADGRLGRARWRHPHWIICLTAFKGRRRLLAAPGQYSELFFLDEAVALAAGHRPCAECRRPAYNAFLLAWEKSGLPGRNAAEIDQALHAARVGRDGRQITHCADIAQIPDGTFLAGPDAPLLVIGPHLLPFTPAGYGPPRPRPASGRVVALTPAPTIAALSAGYRPLLHPSAGPASTAGANQA